MIASLITYINMIYAAVSHSGSSTIQHKKHNTSIGCSPNIPLTTVDKGLRLLQPLLHASWPLLPSAIDRRHSQWDGWGPLLLAPTARPYCIGYMRQPNDTKNLLPLNDLLCIHFKCPLLKQFWGSPSTIFQGWALVQQHYSTIGMFFCKRHCHNASSIVHVGIPKGPLVGSCLSNWTFFDSLWAII